MVTINGKSIQDILTGICKGEELQKKTPNTPATIVIIGNGNTVINSDFSDKDQFKKQMLLK